MVNRIPAGADKAYDMIEHIESLRATDSTHRGAPELAHIGRRCPGCGFYLCISAIDGGDLAD